MGSKTIITPGYVTDANEASSFAKFYYGSGFSNASDVFKVQVSNLNTVQQPHSIAAEADYVSNP